MNLRILFTLSLLLLASLNSCRKDLTNNPAAALNSVQKAGGALDRSDGSATPELDRQAFKDKVNAEHEFTGRTMYEHLAYFQGSYTLYDYIPQALRPSIQQQETAVKNAGAGLETYEDIAAYARSFAWKPTLSGEDKTDFLALMDRLDVHLQTLTAKIGSADFKTFGQMWYFLKSQEEAFLQDATMPELHKQSLLLYNSVLRNYLKYQYATGGFGVDDRSECDNKIGNIKITCIIKHGFWGLVKLFIGVSVSAIATSTPLIAIKLSLQLIQTINKVKYLNVLAVYEIIKKLNSPECKCNGSSSGGTGDTGGGTTGSCHKPGHIGLLLDGCGMIQTAVTSSFGTYSGRFIWNLGNGLGYDPGNPAVHGKSVSIVTDEPSLKIQQLDKYLDVVVSVSLMECAEPTGGEFAHRSFNFHEITHDEPAPYCSMLRPGYKLAAVK